MYTFVNTREEISSNSEVVKALSKLEKKDFEAINATVTYSKGDMSKGESLFNCKITFGKIIRVGGGDRPEFATKTAVNDFIDAVRSDKTTKNTKRLNVKLKTRELKRHKD